MKIRDLIDVLSKCDSGGQVSLNLPTSLVGGNGEYDPDLNCLFDIEAHPRWTTEANHADGLADLMVLELPIRERGFLTASWHLLTSVVISKPLTDDAHHRLEEFLVCAPEPCAFR